MKRLIFFLLLVIAVLGITLGLRQPRSDIQLEIKSAKIEKNLIQNSSNQPTIKINRKTINVQNIYQYLDDIVGERYAESDLDFIQNELTAKLQTWGYTPELQPFETGVNIVAKREGTDPDQGTILVAAHYDTIANSPGADDNGSGLAVALEIAQLLAVKTPKTLEIVFFDQEENGLQGSFAFTAKPENLENLKAAIILDMVGYACYTSGCQTYPAGLPVQSLLAAAGIEHPDQGEFLAVVGETQHLDLLNVFQSQNVNNTKFPPIVTVPVPLKGLLTPDVLRSDHAPFWSQNIPAVLITDTAELRSPHYHQPSDTIETLDQSFLIGSAQIILNAVQDLLN